MCKNLRTDVDLWVKCANGSLIKVLGMGDVGFLINFLLAPQHRKDLISEGQLMRENDRGINSGEFWKRVLDWDLSTTSQSSSS